MADWDYYVVPRPSFELFYFFIEKWLAPVHQGTGGARLNKKNTPFSNRCVHVSGGRAYPTRVLTDDIRGFHTASTQSAPVLSRYATSLILCSLEDLANIELSPLAISSHLPDPIHLSPTLPTTKSHIRAYVNSTINTKNKFLQSSKRWWVYSRGRMLLTEYPIRMISVYSL